MLSMGAILILFVRFLFYGQEDYVEDKRMEVHRRFIQILMKYLLKKEGYEKSSDKIDIMKI